MTHSVSFGRTLVYRPRQQVQQQAVLPNTNNREDERKQRAETDAKIKDMEALISHIEQGQANASKFQAEITAGLKSEVDVLVKTLEKTLTDSKKPLSEQRKQHQAAKDVREHSKFQLFQNNQRLADSLAEMQRASEKNLQSIEDQYKQEKAQFEQQLLAKGEEARVLGLEVATLPAEQHTHAELTEEASKREKAIAGLRRNIRNTKQQIRDIQEKIAVIEKRESELNALFAQHREQVDRNRIEAEHIAAREVMIAQKEIVFQQESKEASELKEQNSKLKNQVDTLKSALRKLTLSKKEDQAAERKVQEPVQNPQNVEHYAKFDQLWSSGKYTKALEIMKRAHEGDLPSLDEQVNRMITRIKTFFNTLISTGKERQAARLLRYIIPYMAPEQGAQITNMLTIASTGKKR